MKQRSVLRPRPGDFVCALLVVLCAAALLLFLTFRAGSSEQVAVEVYQSGQLLYTLPLNQDGEWTMTGEYENVITIRDGRVAVNV